MTFTAAPDRFGEGGLPRSRFRPALTPGAVPAPATARDASRSDDGAALDAAQAMSTPARVQAPPAGRRPGKPGRR